MNSKLSLKGNVTIDLINVDGTIEKTIKCNNLVLATGEVYVANKLTGATITDLSDMAIGVGTTAPVTGDTALQNETARSAFLAGPTQGTGADNNKITMVSSFGAGVSTGTITEAGLFYDTTIFSRLVFAGVVKGVTQALSVTWEIEVLG